MFRFTDDDVDFLAFMLTLMLVGIVGGCVTWIGDVLWRRRHPSRPPTSSFLVCLLIVIGCVATVVAVLWLPSALTTLMLAHRAITNVVLAVLCVVSVVVCFLVAAFVLWVAAEIDRQS